MRLSQAQLMYSLAPLTDIGMSASMRVGVKLAQEVVPEQACVVRQVFDWVGRERATIGQVCRRLQQAGVLTQTGKKVWDRSTVWGMLKNPAYKGMAAFGKTQVGQMRPRIRPSRGACAQPKRAYSTYESELPRVGYSAGASDCRSGSV